MKGKMLLEEGGMSMCKAWRWCALSIFEQRKEVLYREARTENVCFAGNSLGKGDRLDLEEFCKARA